MEYEQGARKRGGRDAVCLLRKKRKREISDFYLSRFRSFGPSVLLDSSVFVSGSWVENAGTE